MKRLSIIYAVLLLVILPCGLYAQQDDFGKKEIPDFLTYLREFKKKLPDEQLSTVLALYKDNVSRLQVCTLANSINTPVRMEFCAAVLEERLWKIEDTSGFYHTMKGNLGLRDMSLKSVNRETAPSSLEEIHWNIYKGVLYLDTSGDKFSDTVKELNVRTDGKNMTFYEAGGSVIIYPDTRLDTLEDDLEMLEALADGSWKRTTVRRHYFQENLERIRKNKHIPEYIRVMTEIAEKPARKHNDDIMILGRLLVLCGTPGIRELYATYNSTANTTLKACIGFTFSKEYFKVEPTFAEITSGSNFASFIRSFITDAKLHAEQSSMFRDTYRHTDYSMDLQNSLSTYIKYNPNEKLRLSREIIADSDLFLLHQRAWYLIAFNYKREFQKEQFALLDSVEVIKFDRRIKDSAIRISALRTLGKIGGEDTLAWLKNWTGQKSMTNDEKKAFDGACKSLETNISYGTHAYRTFVRDFRYDLYSTTVINILAHHPVNLFDSDPETSWTDSLSQQLEISFLTSFMYDKIILRKYADSANDPVTEAWLTERRHNNPEGNEIKYTIEENETELVISFEQPHEAYSFVLDLHYGKNTTACYHTIEFYLEGTQIEISAEPFLESFNLY